MANRKRIQKFDSKEVQGEESWVLVGGLTVAEMRQYRKEAKKKNFDAFEAGVDVLKTHVYKWNWVDDDGSPLPQPEETPRVIDRLSDAETDFLSKCVHGDEEARKNS